MLISRGRSYEEIYQRFQWRIPQRYNIASDVCDRHADDASKIALIHELGDGGVQTYTFREVQRFANQFANTLRHYGLKQGDRVILLLGQHPATAIAHIACWKAGLVSVPTSVLFGADALKYRVEISGARAVLTDVANYSKVVEVRGLVESLAQVFLVDGAEPGALRFWDTIGQASDDFATLALAPDTPAFINFTSGTTGWPKAALQGHRSMLGHMPGVEFVLDFFPQPRDVMWSPADWAWLAGLMDVLMPAWFHGVPVLTYRAIKFDAEYALRLMGKHRVTTALLTPTVLKQFRQVPDPRGRFGVNLRAVLSGSESVGKELHTAMSEMLGIAINEGFGQTECNMVLGNSSLVMPVKPGSLGRPLPGHVGAIIDDAGNKLPPGASGHIAFRRPDPVMMLEYLNNPKATSEKYIGDWLITGDVGSADEDGYFWFHGRADDVITSSGYRIGPSEIEDAILRHPKVALAAAIGVPDPVRTEAIKAFIVLAQGCEPSEALADEIRASVRDRLAKHEYPRMIEFVDALPMTTTGKILRRELRDRERAKRAENDVPSKAE